MLSASFVAFHIALTTLCFSGSDARKGRGSSKLNISRSEPPRVPNSSGAERNDHYKSKMDRYYYYEDDDEDSRRAFADGPIRRDEFDEFSLPCQLLLRPFKSELMRDRSTFSVNVDHRSSNDHLIDMQLRESRAEARFTKQKIFDRSVFPGFRIQFIHCG